MSEDVRNTLEKTSASWLLLRSAPADPVARLSTALGSGWSIERQADCMGDEAIIVMPSSETEATAPTFILYEKAGLAHVGIVRDDTWESDRDFTTFAQAAEAIIAEATALSISPEGKTAL